MTLNLEELGWLDEPGEISEEVYTSLPAVMAGPVSWSPRLPFDMAMGDEDSNIQVRYELSDEEYQRILAHPVFRREVSEYIREIREKGVTFKAKAKLQAEEYLLELDEIATNRALSPGTRLDAIKFVVRCAELDGGANAAQAGNSMPQINVQINL